ncbi:MAG: tRNA epoxyqueuosine(34) reductase QueG, partial [Bacteroidetes bacterium]|nr:tRNA epoxyqueuosine(34) reductase QueG [Bacteroidota bacterium]
GLNEGSFKPNSKLLKITRKEWEMLDEQMFSDLFSNSAIKRIGFKKIKENIKLA